MIGDVGIRMEGEEEVERGTERKRRRN